MPPRIPLRAAHISQPLRPVAPRHHETLISNRYTGVIAVSITSSAPHTDRTTSIGRRHASTKSQPQTQKQLQPPSHRNPAYRKSQLHRQYTSLLRTTPLIIFYQHNNLQSVEWAGIRRELNKALQKVDEEKAAAGDEEPALASTIKLQTIQTGIFESALRVVEFFRPEELAGKKDLSDGTHDLSRAARDAVLPYKGKHELSTILMGPLAILTFPRVSPAHLKAAFSILSPAPGTFPAPSRKLNPGYHDRTVQDGLKKTMMLAARVDGRVFDADGARWIGGIQGGMGGLRSQLVAALQGVGAGVTGALEGAGKSLYLTLESRRSVLDEEQNGEKEEKKTESS
jgi:large subunit ribosomal protein L10